MDWIALRPGVSYVPIMIRYCVIFLVSCTMALAPTLGQDGPISDSRPVEGLRETKPQSHVLRGARIVTAPGKLLKDSVVVVRGGLVTAVGAQVAIPPDARLWDLEGMTIYPGFIDPYADEFCDSAKFSDSREVTHWSEKVRPERRAAAALSSDSSKREKRRKMGYTAAGVPPVSGIFRGEGCAIQLGNGAPREVLLSESTGQFIAFETAGRPNYPASLMGCIALIRQVFSDARWDADYREAYSRNPGGFARPEANLALQSLAPLIGKRSRAFFHAGNELDFSRILAIAGEAGIAPHFIGNGYEYRVLDHLKRSSGSVILPVAFPASPPVDDPDRALDISLEQLQHWEQAPRNAAALDQAGVAFAFTTKGAKDGATFWKNIRASVKNGLSVDRALAAMTTRAATLLGMEAKLGTIEPGKIANFTVFDSSPFEEKEAKLQQVWIDGQCYPMDASREVDLSGEWTFSWGGLDGPDKGIIRGKSGEAKLQFGEGDSKVEVKLKMDGRRIVLETADEKIQGQFKGIKASSAVKLVAQFHGTRLSGIAQLPDGRTVTWFGDRTGDPPDGEEEDGKQDTEEAAEIANFAQYPAGAFGVPGSAIQPIAHLVVRGATVWKCDGSEPVETCDVLFSGGKVAQIGSGISAPEGALEIDGKGKHVTAGLIDAHSHIAISRGVNEGTHAVTVEVRIGDVVDPTDISIYRQLAGGLTTSNLLHGSANPMGGQNQVIKLRWGHNAEGMKFEGAKPGVKFALGENVKQSNWGERYTTRYPQTRMGVEQIMKDTFLAARAYEKSRNSADGKPVRRDLRLEAALEILKGERIVHIHSYRQDEILMFVRLAQEFGFTVGTFQHVLEGYKVADQIAEIGAGGSSFSDWWAYKFEVYDAIPHNGALLHDAGVVTSFNSDDAELARRMNTEAAKAVKYGGVPEEQAILFVTLNPAKQLRIDNRVGSLEPGKDADFVIWSGHPLSTYSRAEQTWIEGVRYFLAGRRPNPA